MNTAIKTLKESLELNKRLSKLIDKLLEQNSLLKSMVNTQQQMIDLYEQQLSEKASNGR